MYKNYKRCLKYFSDASRYSCNRLCIKRWMLNLECILLLPQQFFLLCILAITQVLHKQVLSKKSQRTKSVSEKFVARDGHAIKLSRQIHLQRALGCRCVPILKLKCAGAHSCWNRILRWIAVGTPFRVFWQNEDICSHQVVLWKCTEQVCKVDSYNSGPHV